MTTRAKMSKCDTLHGAFSPRHVTIHAHAVLSTHRRHFHSATTDEKNLKFKNNNKSQFFSFNKKIMLFCVVVTRVPKQS